MATESGRFPASRWGPPHDANDREYCVASNAASGVNNTISNSASVTQSTETRVNTGDDRGPQSTSVVRSVDLTVTVTDAPHTVVVGSGAGNLVYTASVKNNGPSDASGIQLTNTQTLPAGVTLLSSNVTAGGSFNGTTGIWTVPFLAAGATGTLTLTDTVGEPAAAGANAISDMLVLNSANEPLINPGDDSAAQSTNIVRNADLTVTVSDSPHTVIAGSGLTNLVYTVAVKNKGPSSAANVQVANTQILPAGVSFVFANPSAGTFDNGLGVWNIGTLSSGATGYAGADDGRNSLHGFRH